MRDDLDPADYLGRHWKTGGSGIQQAVDHLVELSAGNSQNAELYREMLLDVVRMAQADRNRWDAKIMLQTIRELEQAFARLELFKRRRKVTVFGSARTPVNAAIYSLAREMGRELSSHDYMVITGAGGGIMAAAHEGAGLDNSLGFNITLPFEQQANPVVKGTDHDISFRFFFLRKLFFIKEADALILCPGGFGTLDETLEVLTLIQTGKSPVVPVVLLEEPGGRYWESLLAFFREQLGDPGYILQSDFNLMTVAHTPEEAMQEVLGFYSNYDSARWVDGRYILRMKRPLTEQALAHLNEHFTPLCLSDSFTQHPGREVRADEPELDDMHCLAFVFNGRDHGLLRALINVINQAENQQNPGTA
ncbi:MAG: LOG family protein [Pseudomonas sp.]